ncbi:SDR family oxidoreductase [bacterium]|nr:SDR family oxidoreductase [bacterium]
MSTQDGKVAIISGGTRGLGAAFAQALLEQGWRVCVFGRRDSEFVQQARAKGDWSDRFIARTVDVRDSAATQKLVRELNSTWGRIDLLVNNAGVSVPSLIALASDEYLDKHLDTNLGAAMRLTRQVVQVMLPQRSGKIINITSVVGLQGYTGMAAYSAAKAGLDAMTRCLAKELGPAGITVNAIAPGYIPTEMTEKMPEAVVKWNLDNTPLGRLATIEEYVPPFLFLVSDGANFINGHTLVVDGGLTA